MKEIMAEINKTKEEDIEDVENEDNKPILMENPFNPSKIDITPRTLTIDLIINRLQADPVEIDLTPEFQRKKNLWDNEQQSKLIESLLIKFPLPAFYFDGTNNEEWIVIDGLQRLCSINNFVVSKKLKLEKLEFLSKLDGSGFDNLDRVYQRQIKETQITAYIVNPGTPDDVKYNLFKRLNTGGLVLTPQEIRHALNHGVPAKFIADLASSKEFIEASGGITQDRMLDREFVTRFFAFYISPISEYKPDLDTYLNNKMKIIYTISAKDLNSIKHNFIESMSLAKDIFGKHAFRKVFNIEKSKNPINRALFEVWSVTLSKLSDKERSILKKNKKMLFHNFVSLMNNDNIFVTSITSATGDTKNIDYRYTTINNLIQEVLKNDNRN
jgi:hypothetical protein